MPSESYENLSLNEAGCLSKKKAKEISIILKGNLNNIIKNYTREMQEANEKVSSDW
jgi:hypothetical protein